MAIPMVDEELIGKMFRMAFPLQAPMLMTGLSPTLRMVLVTTLEVSVEPLPIRMIRGTGLLAFRVAHRLIPLLRLAQDMTASLGGIKPSVMLIVRLMTLFGPLCKLRTSPPTFRLWSPANLPAKLLVAFLSKMVTWTQLILALLITPLVMAGMRTRWCRIAKDPLLLLWWMMRLMSALIGLWTRRDILLSPQLVIDALLTDIRTLLCRRFVLLVGSFLTMLVTRTLLLADVTQMLTLVQALSTRVEKLPHKLLLRQAERPLFSASITFPKVLLKTVPPLILLVQRSLTTLSAWKNLNTDEGWLAQH